MRGASKSLSFLGRGASKSLSLWEGVLRHKDLCEATLPSSSIFVTVNLHYTIVSQGSAQDNFSGGHFRRLHLT